jgi:hypothetical protein
VFAALLTSRFVPESEESPSHAVATGRFRFKKKSLHFTFLTANVGDKVPTGLRFLNQKGQILEEVPIRLNERQKREGVVCGIWRKVPRSYRRMIKVRKSIR